MPIVQIDGVGRVQLDDSFSKLSPAEQEAQINEIASSASRSHPQQGAPAPVAAAPAPAPIPDPQAMGGGAPPAPVQTNPNPTKFDFDKLERDYQATRAAALANDPHLDADGNHKDQTSFLGATGLGALDGLTFGFDDEIGSGLASVIPGLGKKSIWDGSSLSDAYKANVGAYRDEKKAAWDEHPGGYLLGGVGSAFVPWGAASKLVSGGKGLINVARAAEELGTASNAARFGKAAREGAGAGALYGLGSSEADSLTGNLKDTALGALGGAALGTTAEGVIGTGLRALPNVRSTRFAKNQADKNPYAAFDAEIAQDLHGVANDTAGSPTDAKARALVSAKQINNLEQRYTGRFKDLISKVVDDPVQALQLKSALEGKHTLTTEDIEGLRGTTAGDAIADAVTKIQRLRKLTPEVARDRSPLSIAGNVASTALDFVPGVPGIVGRAVRFTTKSVAGDAEAARVHSAERVLKNIDGYNKLADIVGPSGQKESSDALWQAAQDAISQKQQEDELAQQAMAKQRAQAQAIKDEKPEVDAYKRDRRANVKLADAADPELIRRAELLQSLKTNEKQQGKALSSFDSALNAPEPGPAPITKKDMADFRRSIADPAPDLREANDLVPTNSKLIKRAQDRNAALAKLEGAQSDWEAKLADPSTAPQPKAAPAPKVNAKDAVIEDNINQGIMGDSGTHNAFTARVGVSKDELMRILDKAMADNPDAAAELNRIRHNYPTKDRTFGSAIVPRLKAIRDEMGITPQAGEAKAPTGIPVDDAAQQRLAEAGGETTTKLTGQAAVREQELLKRLDEVDPVEVSLVRRDGTGTDDLRASEAPDVYKLSDADRKEAESIRAELRQLRQVDRPVQWEAGKSRYQTMANGTIDDLKGDIRIGDTAMGLLKRVPEKIRDNFKTTEEAQHYIENEVVPDLETSKVPSDEIDRIKGYLYEIASHKPYATREAYEAGTRANPRGRPRKSTD